MDKSIYTGVNADVCIMIDADPDKRRINGDIDEVCDLLGEALTDALTENPHMRRPLFRAMWRVWKDTLPEVFAYWIEGWPFTVIGITVAFWLLYGFAALMRALGS